MSKILNLTLNPEQAAFDEAIHEAIQKETNRTIEFSKWKIVKKSIDARKREVKIQLRIRIFENEEKADSKIKKNYKNVSNCEEVIIIGAGPAGLFAALTLLENGKKPIILERGKNVKDRRRDIADIKKKHIVNSESNSLFGEGGAGTYSGGKLYTRSKKRGSIIDILETLVYHGAKEDILIEAQYIGTNKLPKIIANMRDTILSHGGEIHFNSKVVDFIIENNSMKGVILENEDKIIAKNTILATGHSARDIFTLLDKKSISIKYKPFAMGIRIEHPQQLIDQIQYSCSERGPYLPAASYKLVNQVDNRGVYSFCMCPGGFIVPAATNKGEIVVNGMSPSKRNSIFSNSGIVVEVKDEELFPFKKIWRTERFILPNGIGKKMCKLTPELQVAPAQRMVDFINKKTSPKTQQNFLSAWNIVTTIA